MILQNPLRVGPLAIGLLNCAAMFALAVDPLPIGGRACLFFDDKFAAEQSGLVRTWHQGQPHDVPAIAKTQEWEMWPHLYGSVFRDPREDLYKLYYTATNYPSVNPPSSFSSYICYAVSRDGKTWTKPKLGVQEFKGSKENNIVIKFAELPNVFFDPREKDPAARLKMFVYLMSQPSHGNVGEGLLSSADGVTWKYVGPYNKPNYADPAHTNYTDSHVFTWDELGQRYLSYVRTWVKAPIAEMKDGRRRSVGISQSQEINRGWSPIVNVISSDEKDDAKAAAFSKDPNVPDWAELYCMHFSNYGNHYLGLLSLFFILDGKDTGGAGDIQLTWSHDGLTWQRPAERPSLIARSNAEGLFPTYITTNGPLELGDQIWLYYSEANGAHPISPFSKSISQIRGAVWRKDGFVSLDAAETGRPATPPVVWEGRRLIVNVKTAADGAVRVGILDEQGQPIAGFAAADCEPLSGDRVRGAVRWKGQSDLSALKGKALRLAFELSKASLYSFRAEVAPSPRVVCIGDSVTRGTRLGVTKEQTFCSLLENWLKSRDPQAMLVNAGVGSDTTAGGLKRLDKDVLAHQPTHVLIMFGLNDAYYPKADGPPLVKLEEYGPNLVELVRRVRAAGAVPVLMTSNPYQDAKCKEQADLLPYIAACRRVALENDVPLIDIFGRIEEKRAANADLGPLYADGLHFTPAGNEMLAEMMRAGLVGIVGD